MRILIATLAVLLGLISVTRAGVLDVDAIGGQPGHYASLQEAVDAAVAGDTILVRDVLALPLEPLVIDGKGLTIVFDDRGGFQGAIGVRRLEVRNIPAGQRLTIRDLQAPAPPPGPAMTFEDNAGSIRLYQVFGVGREGDPQTASGPARPGSVGAVFDNCADVMLRDSGFVGGAGGAVLGPDELAPSDGGAGALITDSKVTAFDSGIGGGMGGAVESHPGGLDAGDGGVGIIATNSDLFFQGASSSGGAGGDTIEGAGGDGGVGIVQSGAGSLLRTSYTSPAGGAAGTSDLGPAGTPGPAQEILGGAAFGLPESLTFPRDVFTTTPVREGEPVVITGLGLDDDFHAVFSFDVGNLVLPFHEGALMVGTPFLGPVYLGHVDFLAAEFPLGPAPELPLGVDMIELQVQVLVTRLGGGLVLGPPEHIVVLDSAF